MLYIFGGRPGVGKSSLSMGLARITGATYLRIDTIEAAVRGVTGKLRGPEGYSAAHGVAVDNLRLGRDVIADCVNPLPLTRRDWRAVAERSKVPHQEIEVVCTDTEEHRRRVEGRSVPVPGLVLPTWEDVMARRYEPWPEDHDRLVIDTAGQTTEQSLAALLVVLSITQATSPLA